MNNLYPLFIFAFVLLACQTSSNEEKSDDFSKIKNSLNEVVDSVLYFRENNLKTDFLARRFSNLDQETAIEIQLEMLKKELANGNELIGWKMGGTAGEDTSMYNPLLGYMLKKKLSKPNDVIPLSSFAGKEIMVEGELGFVFNKDFPNGVNSIDELKNSIAYVVPAIEFAQSNALPSSNNPNGGSINYTLAFGMGQVGVLLGDKKVALNEIDLKSETVTCLVNGEKVASGGSARIMFGHLKALEDLVNLLPKYGQMIRKGEVVITGSMYVNPVVSKNAKVQVKFSTLGDINVEISE